MSTPLSKTKTLGPDEALRYHAGGLPESWTVPVVAFDHWYMRASTRLAPRTKSAMMVSGAENLNFLFADVNMVSISGVNHLFHTLLDYSRGPSGEFCALPVSAFIQL